MTATDSTTAPATDELWIDILLRDLQIALEIAVDDALAAIRENDDLTAVERFDRAGYVANLVTDFPGYALTEARAVRDAAVLEMTFTELTAMKARRDA